MRHICNQWLNYTYATCKVWGLMPIEEAIWLDADMGSCSAGVSDLSLCSSKEVLSPSSSPKTLSAGCSWVMSAMSLSNSDTRLSSSSTAVLYTYAHKEFKSSLCSWSEFRVQFWNIFKLMPTPRKLYINFYQIIWQAEDVVAA